MGPHGAPEDGSINEGAPINPMIEDPPLSLQSLDLKHDPKAQDLLSYFQSTEGKGRTAISVGLH